MQEQEENFQPKDIARCRADFFTALAKLEASLRPTPKPMTAKPAPPRIERTFVVHFPFDSAQLSAKAKNIIGDVVATTKTIGVKRLYVSGHTDRAGDQSYNITLSEKRSEAVVGVIVGGGVSSRLVSFGSFGESIPAVATKDGVRSQANRRVVIELSN